jgi:hypothetical protein
MIPLTQVSPVVQGVIAAQKPVMVQAQTAQTSTPVLQEAKSGSPSMVTIQKTAAPEKQTKSDSELPAYSGTIDLFNVNAVIEQNSRGWPSSASAHNPLEKTVRTVLEESVFTSPAPGRGWSIGSSDARIIAGTTRLCSPSAEIMVKEHIAHTIDGTHSTMDRALWSHLVDDLDLEAQLTAAITVLCTAGCDSWAWDEIFRSFGFAIDFNQEKFVRAVDELADASRRRIIVEVRRICEPGLEEALASKATLSVSRDAAIDKGT